MRIEFFAGLKLCYRKREWEYNNTYHHKMSLRGIKQKILEASEAIYNSFGDSNETWKDVVTQMMYPKSHNLRVINTSYVIPPKCVSFGEISMDDIDETSILRDIYLDYHLKLGEMKNDPATDAITLKHISDIYAVDSEKVHDNGYVQFPMAWVANDHLLRSAVVHVVPHRGTSTWNGYKLSFPGSILKSLRSLLESLSGFLWFFSLGFSFSSYS